MLRDIEKMHAKFNVQDVVDKMDDEQLRSFLSFRIGCIKEELDETSDAFMQGNAEEVVDGLIDIMVFTLGTLDLFDVDAKQAWKEVMNANLAKEVGIKPGRPNPYGLPDLVKPDGWVAPTHKHNHGAIGVMFHGK